MIRPVAADRSPKQSVVHIRGLHYTILIVCAATTLGFACVGRAGVFLFLDEFHSLVNLERGYGFLLTSYDSHGSGIALPLLQRLCADLFGDGLAAYRLPAALGAIGAVLLCFPVARRLVGTVPASIAILLLCSNSLFIYYSRVGRSYSLAVFLVLAIVLALNRALDSRTPNLRGFGMLSLGIALAPYLHLATAPVVGAIAGAGFLTLAARGDWATHGRWLLGSLLAGALLSVLLHLPAWGAIASFLGGVVEGRENEFIHDWTFVSIAGETLAGGRVAFVLWGFGVPIATIWFLIERRGESPILLAAALSSLVVLLLFTPRGAPVAWARYLLICLPFVLMLLAWWIVRLCRLLPVTESTAEGLGLTLGGVLAILGFLSGPLGTGYIEQGSFSNGYLAARPIAAHNTAWSQTPSFYRELALDSGQGSLIEVPELRNRRVYLYRNYYLQHGRDVLFGTINPPRDQPVLFEHPYVPLFEAEAIRASGAEYLVVHLNVQQEAAGYEAFVAKIDRVPRPRRAGTPGTRHGLLLGELALEFEREWGVPYFRDAKIAVWKLF